LRCQPVEVLNSTEQNNFIEKEQNIWADNFLLQIWGKSTKCNSEENIFFVVQPNYIRRPYIKFHICPFPRGILGLMKNKPFYRSNQTNRALRQLLSSDVRIHLQDKDQLLDIL